MERKGVYIECVLFDKAVTVRKVGQYESMRLIQDLGLIRAFPDIWEEEPLESSPAEEDFDVLVNERLNMRQRYKLPGRKANSILGCINRVVAAGRGRGLSPSALPS